jgi:hypothetical protein
MKPSTVFEFQIARVVDQFSRDGKLALRTLADVTSCFEPSSKPIAFAEGSSN